MNLETNGDFIYRLFMLTNWSPHSLKAVVKLSVSLFSFSERGTMGNSNIVGAPKLRERLQIVKKNYEILIDFFQNQCPRGAKLGTPGQSCPPTENQTNDK